VEGFLAREEEEEATLVVEVVALEPFKRLEVVKPGVLEEVVVQGF
jgi:hypothetical protein